MSEKLISLRFKALKKKYTSKGSFAANVLTLLSGTSIAQAISVAISPILSRIYTPDDFGIFALYFSLSLIMAEIATGRYAMAIMIPKEDEDALNLFGLSIIIAGGISLISFIIVWIFNDIISRMLGNLKISNWLYWIPITVFLIGCYETFSFFANRNKQYNRLSATRVSISSMTGAINLVMGFAKIGSTGLLIGNMVGRGVTTCIFGWRLWRENRNQIGAITKDKLKFNAARYKQFPIYSAPAALMGVFSENIPILLLSKLFSETIVGHYSFAYKILDVPMRFIGASVGQVFFQRFSESMRHDNDSKILLLKTWSHLAILGFIPTLAIFLFGREIFSFVFGAQWAEGGKIASCLSPWLYAMFISSPTSTAYLVLGLQKLSLFFGIASLIYRPVWFFIGSSMNNIYFSLYAFVIVEICQTIVYNIILLKKMHRKKK